MQKPASTVERAALAALVIGLCGLLAIIATLPAMPIDETRYLTVAWEMRSSGSWSLPTLNFEPYSHKPPLLFWLINVIWSVLGLEVWPARLVGVLSMAAVLAFTHRLDRELAPEGTREPPASALLLLGLPVFVALGVAIMFDMLLTATVTGGLLALWRAGRTRPGKTGGRLAWALYGLAIGLGLLAKGPIVLVFLLPPALLAPYWVGRPQRTGWYLRLVAAVCLGAAIALAWAIRASLIGGPDYAEMLFWKQSAGRITESFAHARPFWFYVPIAALFFFPTLLWRPLREGLSTSLRTSSDQRNFLLSWILPALVVLSLISGKQIHYLLPVVPGIAILISLGLRQVELLPGYRWPVLIFAVALIVLATVLVLAGPERLPVDGTLSSAISNIHGSWVALTSAAALSALLLLHRTMREALIGMALANLIFVAGLTAQARPTIAELYDLQPMADVISGLRDHPIATIEKSRGEYGFLARLTQPLVFVPEAELPCWLKLNPSAAAIMRTRLKMFRPTNVSEPYRTLYRRTFRNSETLKIVQGQGDPVCLSRTP